MRPWAAGPARRTPAGTSPAADGDAPGGDRRPGRGLQEQRVGVGPGRGVRRAGAAGGPGPPPRAQRVAAAQAGPDRPAPGGGPGSRRAAVGAGVPGGRGRALRGEGAKGGGRGKFANSHPRMVSVYCAWLRRFFEIDETRLRLRLYLHQGLDLDASIAFWSELTGIPPSQFQKPYRATPDASIRHTKHVHGCASVDYSCSSTHRTIMGLVRALLGGAVLPG